MSIPFLNSIDLNGNQVLNVRAQVLASDPGSPSEGLFYYNATSKVWRYYTGSTWITLGRLDQTSAPTGDVSMNSQKLTNVAAGTASTDAVNLSQLQAVQQGIDAKAGVKAATTANITLSGTQTIDGVSCIAGDRVLVKDQSTASGNGIYVVASGAWTRATDMDDWAEVPGAFVFVESGSTLADTGWLCTADPGGTLGSTSIAWVQFIAAGTVTASNVNAGGVGVFKQKTGNDLEFRGINTPSGQGAVTVALDAANNEIDITVSTKVESFHDNATAGLLVQTSSTAVTGRTLTGAAAGVSVTNGNGVSGNPTLVLANDLAAVEGLATTGLVRRTGTDAWSAGTQVATAEVADNAVTNAKAADMATATIKGRATAGTGDPEDLTAAQVRTILGAPRSYAANVGATSSGVVTVSHSLGTKDVIVQLYRIAAPSENLVPDVERTDANTVTLRFGADYAVDTFRVLVLALGV